MKNVLQSIIIRWMYSKVPFPAPGFLLPHIFGWAIGARIYERVTWDADRGKGGWR